MHELSIALGVLDVVRASCAELGHRSVQSVRVRIGRATGVVPDALQFAFEHARAGTPAATATLEIEAVPLGGRCEGCGAEFTTEERYVFACPRCGGGDFRITGGNELQVVELEVEE